MITGCAVAPACVNSDRPSQWEIADFDLLENRRLPQNSAQLVMSARGPPKPNLVQIHAMGASWEMCEI